MAKGHKSTGGYLGVIPVTNTLGMLRETHLVYSGVVTSGLVLYWDFGNPGSYPGSGSTLYDLSGAGYNGTINGTGTFLPSTNGGSYQFSGSTNSITNSSFNLSTSNFTVMGSTRYAGTGTDGRVITCSTNNWLLGNHNNHTRQYFATGWVYGAGQSGSNYYVGNDTNWHIYTGTGLTNYSLYDNNVLITTNTAGSQGPNGIAVNGYSTEPSNAFFGFLMCYNRVLTQAEMTQNYNYFRNRYGI
jgi:hypothetical protein